MRFGARSRNHAPAQRLAGGKRNNALDFLRDDDVSSLQSDGFFADGEIVEARAVDRSKGFELVERVLLLEHRRIALDREGRVEDASTAAGAFLGVARVRRAVSAEEYVGPPGDCRLPHRQPVLLALGNRQAVSVGPEAAGE